MAELHRRGRVVLDGMQPFCLPGLRLHPGAQVLDWQGREYTVTPVLGRVLLALAHRWPGTLDGRALNLAVWGQYVDRNNARVAVRALRQRCPGLVERVGYVGYRLNLGGNAPW